MRPRDLFDALLVTLLAVSLYGGATGFSPSPELFWRAVEAVLGVDIAVYLVFAGVLGVAFVGYIAVYLPRKQSGNAPR